MSLRTLSLCRKTAFAVQAMTGTKFWHELTLKLRDQTGRKASSQSATVKGPSQLRRVLCIRISDQSPISACAKCFQAMPIALAGKASSVGGTDASRRVPNKASRFAGCVIRIGRVSAADSAVSPSSCATLCCQVENRRASAVNAVMMSRLRHPPCSCAHQSPANRQRIATPARKHRAPG